MTEKNTALVAALVASVLNLPNDSVGANASMENTPQWDSLAQLNICLALQEKTGVVLDMDAIANSTSVVALAALIPS